jgi:guanylate cyclase 32E
MSSSTFTQYQLLLLVDHLISNLLFGAGFSSFNSIYTLQKCADRTVSNKIIYSTFARTLPPSSKVSKSLISLLKYYNWTKVSLERIQT